MQLWLEVDKKVSDDFKRHLTSVGELFEEFGPARVLLIEMPGTSAEKTAEIAAKLKAKIGTSAKAVESTADGEATINIGPVDDFDKFVAGIDFGTVTDKDPGQRMVEIHTGPAPIGGAGVVQSAASAVAAIDRFAILASACGSAAAVFRRRFARRAG